jgi:hypothetical protein
VNLSCRVSERATSVTWDHLDPNSGFRVLLIYAAPRQLAPDLNLSVVGMHNPTHVDLTQHTKEIPQPPETDAVFDVLAFFLSGSRLSDLVLYLFQES